MINNKEFRKDTSVQINRYLTDYGKKIDIYTKEFHSANILRASAGTTGFCGGDSGHGARTYFAVWDTAGTDIRPRIIQESYEGNGGFAVTLGGDCEIITIINALQFIVDTLKKQTGFKDDDE